MRYTRGTLLTLRTRVAVRHAHEGEASSAANGVGDRSHLI